MEKAKRAWCCHLGVKINGLEAAQDDPILGFEEQFRILLGGSGKHAKAPTVPVFIVGTIECPSEGPGQLLMSCIWPAEWLIKWVTKGSIVYMLPERF